MELDLVKQALETNFTGGMPADFIALKEYLNNPQFPNRAQLFKDQLTYAIANSAISPQEFEKLTTLDMDSQEAVDRFLVEELWQQLYGKTEK